MVWLAGCSAGSQLKAPPTDDASGGQDGASTTLTTETCWSGLRAGADPQTILRVAKQFSVTYFDAAHALADRAAFSRTRSCSEDHGIEVYKGVRLSDVTPQLTDYTVFLRPDQSEYAGIDQAVRRACMNQVLLQAADASGVAGALVEPAFPAGFTLGWAPPSPAQWAQGQRVYACTLAQEVASPLLYAEVFTHGFPTEDRTCIDSASLVYVDCARNHDRERIAGIDVTAAVRSGAFPGTTAIKTRASGPFVDFGSATFAALDRACTTYLRSVSTTTKLTGVAEPEVDQWPTRTGRFQIACEADAAPSQRSVVTQGSVYNR
ncbi:MAG: hypothetical protein JWR52_2266 [Marmoricola sp.]|nr:hypothetical protein [Marmoricola sp.]